MENKKDYMSILRADEVEDFNNLLAICEKTMNMKVTDIAVLAGGLTNKSFTLTFEDGTKAVMRLAGKGTGEYISRAAEKHNSTAVGEKLGIAPKVYYFDADTGSQLAEFIKMPTLHDVDFREDRVILKKAAELLHALHFSGIRFMGDFDPIKGTEDYINILVNMGFEDRYQGFKEIYAMVLRIRDAFKKNPPLSAPLHCDTLAENFMYNGTDMKLIDWEYGAQGDPYYDVSGIMTEDLLDDAACEDLLKFYFGGEPTAEERARVFLNRFLYCTYWSAWSLVQIANGKDRDLYWQYGLDRAILGMQYMSDPKFEGYLKTIESL